MRNNLLEIPVTMWKALGDQEELPSALPPSLPPPLLPSFFPQMTSPVFSTLESSHGLFSVEESVKGETINKRDTTSTTTRCLDEVTQG